MSNNFSTKSEISMDHAKDTVKEQPWIIVDK